MTPDQRRIYQLEADLADLRRRVEQIPRAVAAITNPLFLAATVRNGTQFYKPSSVASGVYGIKYKTGLATRTTVPNAVGSSNFADSYDGLATADIIMPTGSSISAFIIVGPCTDVNGKSWPAVFVSAPNNSPIILWSSPITLATEGGSTAPVYRVYGI